MSDLSAGPSVRLPEDRQLSPRERASERGRQVAVVVATVMLGGSIGAASNAALCLVLCAASVLVATVAGRTRTWVALAVAPVGQLLGAPWPLAALTAAAAALLLERAAPHLVLQPLHLPGRWAWPAVAAAAIVSPLPAWLLAEARFSADPLALSRPEPSPLLLAVVVVGAAVVNGLGEEVLWRQCLLGLALRSGVPVGTALVSVSVSFGLAHANGIPAGVSGTVAAGLLGLLLGVVRLRRGLLAAVLLHVLVDVALFSAVARHTLFLG